MLLKRARLRWCTVHAQAEVPVDVSAPELAALLQLDAWLEEAHGAGGSGGGSSQGGADAALNSSHTSFQARLRGLGSLQARRSSHFIPTR